MPRRVYDYSQFGNIDFLWTLNWIATVGAFLIGLGQLVFLGNLVWTFVKGPVSDPDPWGSIPAQDHIPRIPGVPVYAMPIHAMTNGGAAEPTESAGPPRGP
jgi:cytochrome c oxidase subunit 1